MKNTKKIIILLMVIMIVVIALLSILLVTQKNSPTNEVNAKIEVNDNTNDLIISEVKDESEYHDIERVVNKYYSYINYLDYNLTQTMLEDKEKQKTKEKYLEKGKNALKNIFMEEYIKNVNWETGLLKYTNQPIDITKMNKCSYNQIVVYLVMIDYSQDKTNIIIFTDTSNDTFSILPSEYSNSKISIDNLLSIVNEINIQNIEKNDNNEIKRLSLGDEQICIQYYYDYMDMLKNDVDQLYSKLDKTYRENRFEDIELLKQYIDNNKDQLKNAILSKYQVNKKDGYTQYVCLDEYGNYYIFNATAAMQYTLILDTYTIDLPEFTEKYNNSSAQEKVALNINKVITALNAQDYKYIYSKLADSFKNNYFENGETLKEYLVNNLYIENDVEFEEFSQEGTIYTYKIALHNADKSIEDESVVKMNIVMQLNDGTDFVMSFSIEEE